MADYYRHFSVAVRLHGKLAAAWVTEMLRKRRKTWQQLVESDEDDAADAVGVDFEWQIEDDHLVMTDDGASGNVEHVAATIRELMRLGYVHEPVAIHGADTCSRPRPGTFTGGAALVTRRRTHWFSLLELVEKKAKSLERRRTSR